MKIKLASSIEELDMAPWREFAGHVEIGLTTLAQTMEKAEIAVLIDAVEQQIAAWEDH